MRAITIIFDGKEVPENIIVKIMELVAYASEGSTIDAHQLTGREIEAIVAGSFVKETAKKQQVREVDPVEQAVVYIGKLFKNTHSDDSFKRALMHKALELSSRPDSEECRRLMNAMFILSQDNFSVNASVMNQCNMSPAKIGMVRRVYNAITKL